MATLNIEQLNTAIKQACDENIFKVWEFLVNLYSVNIEKFTDDGTFDGAINKSKSDPKYLVHIVDEHGAKLDNGLIQKILTTLIDNRQYELFGKTTDKCFEQITVPLFDELFTNAVEKQDVEKIDHLMWCDLFQRKYGPPEKRDFIKKFLCKSREMDNGPAYRACIRNVHPWMTSPFVNDELFITARDKNPERFQELLEFEKPINHCKHIQFEKKCNILHIARAKQIKHLRTLSVIDESMVNAPNEYGKTPIEKHIEDGSVDCVEELIKTGLVSPNTFVNKDNKIVNSSFIWKGFHMVKLIVETFFNGERIEACNSNGYNLIHLACLKNNDKWHETLTCILSQTFVTEKFVSSLVFENCEIFNEQAIAFVRAHEKYVECKTVVEDTDNVKNIDVVKDTITVGNNSVSNTDIVSNTEITVETNTNIIETDDCVESDYTLISNVSNVPNVPNVPNVSNVSDKPSNDQTVGSLIATLKQKLELCNANIASSRQMIESLEIQNKEITIMADGIKVLIEQYEKQLSA